MVHNGAMPYAGAVAALTALRDAGRKVAFVSNSSRPAAPVARHLAAMGVTAYDALVTSGALVAAALREDPALYRPGFVNHAIIAGRLSLLAEYEAPVTPVQDPAAAGLVINAYYAASHADLAAQQPALQIWREHALAMLCVNPDTEAPHHDGVELCPGALAAAYEAIGGRVLYYGKPHAPIYAAGLAALNLPPNRVAMIGDNMATDITGAAAFGIPSILITGGIHSAMLGYDPQKLPPPAALQKLCAPHKARPTYILPRLVF